MGEVCDAWVVGHSRMGIPKSHVDAKITTLLNYFKRDAALDRIQLLIVMYVITGGRVHRPPHKIVSQHKLVCFIFFFFISFSLQIISDFQKPKTRARGALIILAVTQQEKASLLCFASKQGRIGCMCQPRLSGK
ncbi:hypothetical protein H101_01424 [Trichophyton interdigitale H6]|nr:hypothetical protein H101_01424 [Trichophyton interdigitale H6]